MKDFIEKIKAENIADTIINKDSIFVFNNNGILKIDLIKEEVIYNHIACSLTIKTTNKIYFNLLAAFIKNPIYFYEHIACRESDLSAYIFKNKERFSKLTLIDKKPLTYSFFEKIFNLTEVRIDFLTGVITEE